MKKTAVFILSLFLIGTLFTGCVEQKEATVKIIDQAGREVEVGKVERIVSLWPEATRVLFALGVQNKLIGLDTDSKRDPILLRAFPEEINTTPDVGSSVRGTLSLEKLAELKPDVVFVRTEDIELANKLQESFGIPVVCVRVTPPPEHEFSLEIISLIGKVVGKEERAQELKSYLEKKMNAVTSVTSQITDSEKPKVYETRADSVLIAHAWAGSPTKYAGGINVVHENMPDVKPPWVTVSMEHVLQWNPDIIILHAFGKSNPEDLLNDSNWQAVKAVKEKKVYKLLIGWVGWYPEAFVIDVMAYAKALHPDKFSYDVEKEANDIFRFVYGVNGLYTELKEDFNLSEV
jgi:iron complex transport system substrate-binding protein